MKKSIMLVLMLCISVAGYAAPVANFDYDTAADFAALKTFDWMPATGNAAGDELLVKKIRNTVDTQLQAKGRSMAADNPDFLIGMELSGKTVNGGSVGVGVSVGIPVGRAGTALRRRRKKQGQRKEGGNTGHGFRRCEDQVAGLAGDFHGRGQSICHA